MLTDFYATDQNVMRNEMNLCVPGGASEPTSLDGYMQLEFTEYSSAQR